MTHRVALTFNNANYAALVARWGSERAYKDWVKAQTLNALAPVDPDIYTSTFVD